MRVPPWLRVVVSGATLAVLAQVLDVRSIARRLSDLQGGWVALALLLSIAQVCISAGRWRYTAARLGVALRWPVAVSEYYLATFLNQVLPGGVMGDVSRAWRHRGESGVTGAAAVHAVILERLSGQIVMLGVASVSLAVLAVELGGRPGVALLVALGVALLVTGVVVRAALPRLQALPVAGGLIHDARRAVFARRAWFVQSSTSLVVVGSYIATWIAATRAVGIDTPALRLLPLVAPVLVTMLIPLTVAGWGVREAGAAALWASVGLTPADGVAVSVAYGLLVLVGSLPGGLVLGAALSRSPEGKDRGRTADPDRVESGAPPAVAPRRGGRSPEG